VGSDKVQCFMTMVGEYWDWSWNWDWDWDPGLDWRTGTLHHPSRMGGSPLALRMGGMVGWHPSSVTTP
jgi:hypothetical protein